MASRKLFGLCYYLETDKSRGGRDGGLSISDDFSRSDIQPAGDALSLSDQRENSDYKPYFRFPHSQSDYMVDSGLDCFVDFFDREPFQIERPSVSGDIDLCEFDNTDEEIELGLEIGIGSGSGQVDGNLGLEVNRNMEISPGQVEVPLTSRDDVQRDGLQNLFSDNMIESDDNVRDVKYSDIFPEDYVVIMGSRPPASKKVVDNLTSEELRKGNIVCAICKDEVVVEEKVKKFPCKHYFHGDCINTWLRMRNTCPVCLFELPTDDLDYEMNKRSSHRPDSS